MALQCRASLVPPSGTTSITGLRSQRPQGLSSLRSSAALSRGHASLTLVVRCDVAGHPSSQGVPGSLFMHSINPESIPLTSLETRETQAPQEPATSGLFLVKLTSAVASLLQRAWKPAGISLLLAAVVFSMPAGDALAVQGNVGLWELASGPTTYDLQVLFFGLLASAAFWKCLAWLTAWTRRSILQRSVVRLQVGLTGTASQLQKDLKKIAADTDKLYSVNRRQYLLQESSISLLKYSDFWMYGYSTSVWAKDSDDAEQAFNRLKLEERSKFGKVQVGDVRKETEGTNEGETVGSEYIVVTILVEIDGVFRLPEVKSQADLKSALLTLGSTESNALKDIEAFWTPENDTLTTKDMLNEYPLLRSL